MARALMAKTVKVPVIASRKPTWKTLISSARMPNIMACAPIEVALRRVARFSSPPRGTLANILLSSGMLTKSAKIPIKKMLR